MKKWIPCELHTHTVHSDGRHTLLEMAQTAVGLGIEFLALTDHNTISGHLERDEVIRQTGLPILRGLEWTTFYGHMLVLGVEKYADWRDLGPQDIQTGIARAKQQGAIVGIAHPFRVGTPVCTGCFWEFEIPDWQEISYIEVWNSVFPSIKQDNKRAFAWWTDLLNQGHRLAATSGRDWHASDADLPPIAVTYAAISDQAGSSELESAVMDAIRQGRLSVTMGPLLECTVCMETESARYEIGDTVPVSEGVQKVQVQVEADFTVRSGKWELPEQVYTLLLTTNQGIAAQLDLSAGEPADVCTLPANGLTWLRAELYGAIAGVRTLIAFTNPIYFAME